jgi:hypothetical protein
LLQRRAPKLAEVIVHWYELLIFRITDCDIETFDLFTAWLNNEESAFMDDYRWPAALPLIKLYIFACDYDIPQLIAFAVSRLDIVPTLGEVQYVYSHTASDSPLRRIIVKAFCATKHVFSHTSGEHNHDFLLDVILHKIEIQDNIDAAMDDAGPSNEDEGVKSKTPAVERTPQELEDIDDELLSNIEESEYSLV